MIYNNKINQTLVEGILLENGTVLAEDGKIESVSVMSHDDDGNPEIMIDSRAIDGQGSWRRRTIKHLVGKSVLFIVNGERSKGTKGFNFTVEK